MKKLYKKVKDFFVFEYNSLWNKYIFWKMKRKADKMHGMTKKRYHVVPISETELIVVDNSYIKWHNKQKGIKKITVYDLIEMSYYSTK